MPAGNVFATRAALLAIAVPLLAPAQAPENSWDRLRQLRPGQKIEVVDKNLKSTQGAFLSYSETAISVQAGPRETSLARDNVLSVKNREISHRKRNVLLGLAIGAAAGLAAGAIRGATYHEEGETGVFVLVFTPIGAGIGAAVGAALPAGTATVYRAAP